MAVIYESGSFKMSTWVALLWGFNHTILLILASYSTITTLL